MIRILLFIVLLVSSTFSSSTPSKANSIPTINVKVINDTVIFNVPNAKSNDSIEFNFYYKNEGEYFNIGGVEFPENGLHHVYLKKNGEYAVTTRINNGKESSPKYFHVEILDVEGNTPDIYIQKDQLVSGLGRQFKGMYTISPINAPKNRSITMRMYLIDKDSFKLRFTQKLSPGQEMEIPRLKGVREYAFTYTVDGKESDFEVFVWDAKYQYYDDTFVVKNFNNNKPETNEKVIKTQAELKGFLVNVLSKKKDEFVTIKNKDLEKYFKKNEIPDSLLTKLFPNKKEKEKYKKLLKNYHCWVSYSKKYNSTEIHLFPIKKYIIEKR
jgi:rRNA processing protein Gar1